MRLRTIRAARMADAMAILRAELGEEAVILGTRRVSGGVEVTAGQDAEDEPVLIAPESVPEIGLPPALRRHNLPAALARRLAGAPLAAALAQEFRFAPLPFDDGPLLLVGPPGAGKTVTCAKLATRLLLAGTPPLLVSADGRRAGAAEQLAAFARVLSLPLSVAGTPGSLAKALANVGAGQTVLVQSGTYFEGNLSFDVNGQPGLPIVVRAAPGAKLPVRLRGAMEAKGDVDVFRVELKAGKRFRGEVQAARWMSTLDAMLTVYDSRFAVWRPWMTPSAATPWWSSRSRNPASTSWP
jgi:hypothetical protein